MTSSCCRCRGGSCNHIGECTDCGQHGTAFFTPVYSVPNFRQPWQCPGCKTWNSPYVERCSCRPMTVSLFPVSNPAATVPEIRTYFYRQET